MSSRTTSLKILQLSDAHLSADCAADYRGQNAEQNLERLIPRAKGWKPDCLLLTGDISEDASPASYQRIAARLKCLSVPVLALPGNHDDPDEMRKHFPQGPWRGPLAYEAGPWLLILMDSTTRGSISGSISQQALDQMDLLVERSSAKHVLLGLHHQPVSVNAPWIDRYGLRDSERLFERLDRTDRLRCIVWGHVHHDFQSTRKGVLLLGAPSTVANSLPGTERFSLDPAGPACRWLKLGAHGSVATGILRGS
ncbi:MAG: metallophosphoesterase [Gammaproteobacteria bacterium]|nr:metallophosphoesterase [Gammaproteobacteria bacterium]